MNNQKIPGKIYVSLKAAAQLAAHAAAQCSGIVSLCSGTGRHDIRRLIRRNGVRGVDIKKAKNGIELDIYVICDGGTDTAALCREAARHTANELNAAGIKTARINIHAAGITGA